MNRAISPGWVTVLIVIATLGSAGAAQVTLFPAADTSLWQRQPANNLGGMPFLPAGTTGDDGPFTRSRLLIRFDVAATLPANAVIDSASIYFRVVRAPDPAKGNNNSEFNAHRVLKPWGEGTKSFTDPQVPMTSTQPATAGETTWLHRFHGASASAWTPPGGDFTDDDFAEAASFAFFALAGADRDYTADLNETGLQDVRDWLADPGSNHGWVLRSLSENFGFTARQFASREYADNPAHRPQLTIVYSLPQPVPPQIQSINRNGNQLTIRFSAQAGVVYRPQRRAAVHSGAWTDLPAVGPLATAGTLSFVDDVTGQSERYYRVVTP
ncbi:MAG TPA: hypothetical protein DCY13_23440 [Verrucomicrobiales bacterium]|nr:hypothetical protein [Verrucomicrobiales bacterium]